MGFYIWPGVLKLDARQCQVTISGLKNVSRKHVVTILKSQITRFVAQRYHTLATQDHEKRELTSRSAENPERWSHEEAGRHRSRVGSATRVGLDCSQVSWTQAERLAASIWTSISAGAVSPVIQPWGLHQTAPSFKGSA